MKTAKQWGREFGAAMMEPGGVDFEAWASAVQADATAGMVPEGECKHSPCLECAFQKVTAERDKAEAELAKAWEAAAEAQREKDAKLLELAGWSKYSVQDLIRGNSLAPRPEAPK